MSVLRFWPYPVVGWLILLGISLIVLIVNAIRLRTGIFQHWPYILGVALVVIGLAVIAFYASRPPMVTAPSAPPTVDAIDDVEDYLARLIEDGDPPGLSVVVVKDGELVYAEGWGDADGPRDIAATPDTVYRWWSITKMFTAVSTMQLVEQGLIDLDDPVVAHLPSFDVRYPSADSTPITIRHLLTHSSGLPDAGMEILGWIHYEGDPSPDQTDLLTATLPKYSTLVAEPGTEGRYTNVGYMVLAAVIEAVTGERYEDYVATNILLPLEMNDTGFGYPADDLSTVGVGSHPVDVMTVPVSFIADLNRAVRERDQDRLWFNQVSPDQTGPSGLLGSPRDMARFMMAMLDGGQFGEARILTPDSVDAMSRPYIDATHSPAPTAGFRFGLGWFELEEDGRRSLAHGGTGMGTVSLMRLFPDERLGIFVAANSTYLGRDFGFEITERLSDLPWDQRSDANG